MTISKRKETFSSLSVFANESNHYEAITSSVWLSLAQVGDAGRTKSRITLETVKMKGSVLG